LGAYTVLIGLIALLCAALFAGAAFYINLAEHPARMMLPTQFAVLQWRPSYARGFAMQATLAVVGGCSGLWQWYAGGTITWLIGGLLLLLNWPYTLLVIMPTNHILEAEGAERRADSAGLLRRWNRLHMARTGLSLLAVGAMATGVLGY
jgi:Domain of unknown function (DUF1772)